MADLSLNIRNRSPARTFSSDTTWRGGFFFIQGADPQFGMFDMFGRKKTDPAEICWDEEIVLMRTAVADINKMSPLPEFFVICGDLVNEFDVTPLKERQEGDLLKILAEIDPSVPIALIPGNHDILGTPTSVSIEHYKKTFGDDYYSFDARGVRCICINSQFFKAFDEVPSHEFLELQENFLRWFDLEIEKAAEDLRNGSLRHAVVFQHIPWFIEAPDEPTDYFNVDYEVRQKYLKKLVEAGIAACFCGHLHKNAGGRAGPNGELEVVTTSAIGMTLGSDPSGLRVVKVTDSKIAHEFYPLGQLPESVDIS